tara:strand:+ start:68283 stop:68741 length:459 start_codon:yes stop_codon:yes gene_type:complete
MEGLNNKSYKKGWTSEEVRRLKSLYDGGLSSEEIALNLDRTRSSIYKAIARFNLTHKNRRRGYDPEKDTVLRDKFVNAPELNPKLHKMKNIIEWFRNNSMTSLEVDRKSQTAHLKEINYANEDTHIKYFESQLELLTYIDDVRKKYKVSLQK